MKLEIQLPFPHLGLVKTSAVFVLTVFCALLFLQTACTAGLLSHCNHPDAHVRDLEKCDFDRCGDDFSAPAKVSDQQSVTQSPSVLLVISLGLAISEVGVTPNYLPPVVINSPRPAGTFPLLI